MDLTAKPKRKKPANGVNGRHLGLSGMYDRLRSVGGKCQISSSPGGGTLVKFVFPLTSKKCLNRITFSIVDDDAGLRDSIVRYLTVKGGFVCAGQYGRAQDALANLPMSDRRGFDGHQNERHGRH